MRVRDVFGLLFDDEGFRSPLGVRGRPGVASGQLALVSMLQFAENQGWAASAWEAADIEGLMWKLSAPLVRGVTRGGAAVTFRAGARRT